MKIINLCAIFILMVFLVNPIGDFPLNDDWSYGKTVKALLDEGSLHFTNWMKMTLIAHIYWGAIWTYFLGFSFTILRFSTLFLALISVLLLYASMREIKVKEMPSFFASLIFLASPLFFLNANTFMTDVPFLSFTLMSFYGFARFMNRGEWLFYILAIFSGLAAVFMRQLELVIFAGFFIIYLRKNFLAALFPLVLGCAAYFTYQSWLFSAYPYLEANSIRADILNFIDLVRVKPFYPLIHLTLNFLVLFIYTALFVSPLLAALNYTKKAIPFIIGAFLIYIPLFWLHGKLLPFHAISLLNFGLGPITLRDVYILHENRWPFLSMPFMLLITLWAILSSALLLYQILKAPRTIYNNFAYVICLLYFLATGIGIITFFDRYHFFVIPFVVFVISQNLTRITRPSVVLLLALMAFTVGGVHDYLSFNRARWELSNKLLKYADPKEIDGGFEFNGWYLHGTGLPVSPPGKSWWFVGDDRYMISLGPVPGYAEVESLPFSIWLTWQEGRVYVLKRI